MSGLYIHIPYCKQRCIYCNFYSCATKQDKTPYIKAIVEEFNKRKHTLKDKIQTIYIGGGTPSTLKEEELLYIFNGIYKNCDMLSPNEITIEANCEDVNINYIKFLKEVTPINRLSIGIQSFIDNDLKQLNRRHSAQKAISAVENAKNIGFKNISIDLMYNLPFSSYQNHIYNLKTAIGLEVEHISAYNLTIEEETMLYSLVKKGKITPIDEEKQLEQMDATHKLLTENNYNHYEISSFALKGKEDYRSKHNMIYWLREEYLGLGAASHSFDGNKRRWNPSSIKDYIVGVNTNSIFYEEETLSDKDKYNEYIMLSLRIKEGISPKKILEEFSPEFYRHFLFQVKGLVDDKLLEINPKTKNYILTKKGFHIQEIVCLKLFVD
ncbi:MAG: radical SAM family heme chaperone HemW [Bacteroidales bacterium]|jgi:oxygen-independent coproporphyrinogen-3 oxidase|nr:radical SAM family heme chaperone HemW [Bacteroidales bacterium]